MGSSFANIQLKAANALSVEQVVQVITELMENNLFEKVEEPEDRSIVFSCDGSSPWLTIYDEFCDDGDQDILDALAEALSLKLGTLAVSNSVYDSDLLYMKLFNQGKCLDTFVNDVDIYNEMTESKRRRQGVPSKWASLAEEISKEEITRIWGEETVFAEDTLWELSKLYSWNTDRSCTGFRYKKDVGWGEGDNVLHFRDNNPAGKLFEEQGPTRLELVSYQPYLDCSTESEETTYFSYSNTGRSAVGISIMMWGSAISGNCFESMEACLILHDGARIAGQMEDIELHYPDQPDKPFLGKMLRFDELVIPAGATLLREASTPKEMTTLLERNSHSRMLMKYTFKPVNSGVYEWCFSVRPNTEPMNGVIHVVKVFIDIPKEEERAIKKEFGFYV
ncbi:hypothetical protein [Paenibacillus sp. BK720]|uniref:hypothetical protein n=1 Tax=Paenibacillus sp. BK720 TaxID=2587092 RepID=UPI00141FCBF3|nr:hypothetical protein [Paenibacillus sp. BK720]NIK69428.1 hypothetical protein [Paenibacillus sp. BK720]